MPSTKYIVRQFLHLAGASVLLVHFGPGENMPNICRVAPSEASCDVAQTAHKMRAFHLFIANSVNVTYSVRSLVT